MKQKKDTRAVETAENRMRMIAPLLAPSLGPDAFRRLRRQLSQAQGVFERTLERYRKQYQGRGFEGLKPKGEQTSACKICQEVLDVAIALRREQPGRNVPSIVDQLQREEVVVPGFLKWSALQDAMTKAGYSAATMQRYRQGSAHHSPKCCGLRNDLWLETLDQLNQRFQNWLEKVYHEMLWEENGWSPQKAFERTE